MVGIMLFAKLNDLSIGGKGSYGIAASAVERKADLPTYLRITDIFDDGTLNLSELKSVDAPNSDKYILKPNDIVFARTGGSTGRNYFYDGSDGVFVYAGFLIKFSIDPEKVNPKYVKYYCRSKQYNDWVQSFNTGSTRGNINAQTFGNMEIPLPERKQQDYLVSILEPIDEKIKNNKQVNDNLQQQAAALFESWFVNYDPWDGVQPSEWENAPLGSFVEIKRGGSPRPIQDFLSDSGLRWLKISDVTSLSSPFVLEIKEHIKEEGLRKTVFLHAGELVLSNSATPGIPKILDVDTCIHDGWLYFPKSELSKYYLYLFFKHIRKELVALGNGSVFTNLKTDILKAFPATKADESTLKEFDALVTPLFDAMLNADRENFKLAAMRDALLPKLMSSEIDVSEVEL
jgi:type I restriction enzyme S subunit